MLLLLMFYHHIILFFYFFGWCVCVGQSLVANEEFQHILRVLNTNVDGKQKIMFAMTSIKGIGRRFANICCKKADVDMNKRFGFWFGLVGSHFLFVCFCCWNKCVFVGFCYLFRAGELSAAELDNLMTVVANPRQFKIPDWFLNRKKDYKDGKYSQVVSNALDMKLRDDLERLKKIRYLFKPYFIWLWCSFNLLFVYYYELWIMIMMIMIMIMIMIMMF